MLQIEPRLKQNQQAAMSATDALDEALLPHLRLEPTEEVMAQYKERRLQEVNRARQAKEKVSRLENL